MNSGVRSAPFWCGISAGAEQPAAGHRPRHAGGRGQAERQAARASAPRDRRRPGLRARRRPSRPPRPGAPARRAAAPAPPSAPGCAGRRRRPATRAPAPGNARRAAATAAAVISVRVAAPSASDRPSGIASREIVAVERFRRRPREIGCSRNRATCVCRHRAGAGQRAVDIGRSAGMAAHPIVDQRVAGPGVEGQDVRRRSSPIQVTLPTPPRLSTASGFGKRRGERGVIERRQRRALAARRDIGACGNRRPRRCRSAAPAARRRRSARCGARPGDAGSCGRESRRYPARAALDGARRNCATASPCSRVSSASTAATGADPAQHAAQPLAEIARDRGSSAPGRRRPAPSPSVSIDRDIDAVERGAAHQPDRTPRRRRGGRVVAPLLCAR